MADHVTGQAGFVAIVGRPNAGKSTLLNEILGSQLSIVSPKAQTTRERVAGILNAERGQIVFIDTPGIHRARPGGMNAYMVDEARSATEDVSAIWYLVDPGSSLSHEEAVIELLASTRGRAPLFLVWTKIDRLAGGAIPWDQTLLAALKGKGLDVTANVRISSRTRAGLPDLLNRTWPLIPAHPPYYADRDQLSDRPTRFFVAELVREQLFAKLADELPYSCAVEVEKYEENSRGTGLVDIRAAIYVERESQKGMVIGSGGKMIKEIGVAARASIEKFLGAKAFVGLQVKVKPAWTRDTAAMKAMGYGRG